MMPGWQSPKLLLLVWFLLTAALTDPLPAFAWGDEGHKVIALIAEHYLDPAVRSKVAKLLAADTDTLTAHDIASEATWADKYRDSDRNGTKIRYRHGGGTLWMSNWRSRILSRLVSAILRSR